MRINDIVITKHGKGIVVDIEDNDCKRLGVKLDSNPFDFSPVYFFPEYVKKVDKTNL